MDKVILALIFLIASCSHQKLNQYELQLITKYKQAKNYQTQGRNETACAIYSEIAQNKDFPLKDLIQLKLLQTCPLTSQDLEDIWKQTNVEKGHYLYEYYLEASYNQSLLLQNYSKLIEYGSLYNDYLKTKKLREEFATNLHKIIKRLPQKNLSHLTWQNLIKHKPRAIKNPKYDQHYKVARDFERVRNFSQARKYYLKVILNPKNSLKIRLKAYYRRAMTYKLKRDKETYSRMLNRMTKWIIKNKLDKNKNVYKDIWNYRLLSSRSKWTIGQANQALSELKSFLNDKSIQDTTKADINLIIGQIYKEKKMYQKANQAFETALHYKEIKKETLEKLTWSLAWNYYLTEQYDKALGVFNKIIKEQKSEDDFYDLRKHFYWMARSLEKLDRVEEANELFHMLVERDPYGYYGIISSTHTKQSLPFLSFSQYPPSSSQDKNLTWLNLLDEHEDIIKKYLKSSQNNHHYSDYHFSKWYQGGIFKFFTLSPKDKEAVYKYDLPMAYPTPFKQETLLAAKKASVPAAFIYSIARQESAFNTHARSWADAFGLLQITPEKAKSLARKYNIPYREISDLYKPDINLEMGSHLLKELSQKTDGHFISIVASYNAGRSPLKKWKKTRFRKDPIEFIEMIPYRETQHYIKLVLRNYVTYQRLLGNHIQLKQDFFKTNFF